MPLVPGTGFGDLGLGRRGLRSQRRGGLRPLALPRCAHRALGLRLGCRSLQWSIYPLPPPGLLPGAGGQLGVAGPDSAGRRTAAQDPESVRLHRSGEPGLRRRRRPGHPCRCFPQGHRLGPGQRCPVGARGSPDPLDLRGRPQVRPARAAPGREIRRHHPRPAQVWSGTGRRGLAAVRGSPQPRRHLRRPPQPRPRLPAAQRLCRAHLGRRPGRAAGRPA